jgi:hypothetical protein
MTHLLKGGRELHRTGKGAPPDMDVLDLQGKIVIPGVTEDVMVTQDILLSEFTGATLHIPHVRTAGAVLTIVGSEIRCRDC